MTKWSLLAAAALAATVATAGFVVPSGSADVEVRMAGAAVYTAWGAIAVQPAFVLAGVVGAGIRRGLAILSG